VGSGNTSHCVFGVTDQPLLGCSCVFPGETWQCDCYRGYYWLRRPEQWCQRYHPGVTAPTRCECIQLSNHAPVQL